MLQSSKIIAKIFESNYETNLKSSSLTLSLKSENFGNRELPTVEVATICVIRSYLAIFMDV